MVTRHYLSILNSHIRNGIGETVMVRKITSAVIIALFIGWNYFLPASFAGRILQTEKNMFAQGHEELVVRDYFNDRRGGTFVDIGCSDYKELSTTYYLEKYLGWKGIGVDALSEYEADYKKYRPNTKFCNYIVTDHSGGTLEIHVNFKQKSLSSIMYKPEANVSMKSVAVPCITLNELLAENGIERVDFLSIDVEGSESLVLSGFDIRHFKTQLVCIEANKNEENNKKISDYFTKNGYVKVEEYSQLDVGQNWYFRPKKVLNAKQSESLSK